MRLPKRDLINHEGRRVVFYVFIILVLSDLSGFSQHEVNPFQSFKFQSSLIEPVLTRETGPNHYFIDFGKDAFGTLIMNFKPTMPDTVIIYLGEKSVNSSAVDRNPGGSIR
jgi:hypothetical protein